MRKLLIPFFLSLGLAVLLEGTYLISIYTGVFVKSKTTTPTPLAVNLAPQANIEGKSLNVLLLGYGGEGHDGGTLSDSLILVKSDLEEKRVNVIAIPRDLWVPIPFDWEEERFFKINAAYAIGLDDIGYPNKKPEFKGEAGGGNLAKYVVGQITGIIPKYFVSVNFEGLVKIIDILGGVEVNVPKTFEDNFYPVKGKENETCGFSNEKIAQLHASYSGFDLEKQFTCRYETLRFEKGKNKMDGEIALKFVRSRHSSEHGGDFARSERQYALLEAIKDKLFFLQALGELNFIGNELVKNVKTDLTVSEITLLTSLLASSKDYQVNFISLTEDNVLTSSKTVDGQFILIPKEGSGNFEAIKKFLEENTN